MIAAAALVQTSHTEIYAFGTLQWRAAGLGRQTISLAWAIEVMSESVLLIFCGRYIHGVPQALALLMLGGVGAIARWIAMSLAPGAGIVLGLQLLHALSFAATYLAAVSVLGWLDGSQHGAGDDGLRPVDSNLRHGSLSGHGWIGCSGFGIRLGRDASASPSWIGATASAPQGRDGRMHD